MSAFDFQFWVMPDKTIRKEDLVQSIADGFQYISYYHPPDFIKSVYQAYLKEQSEPARNALAQILKNSRMAAMGKRPLCQDTGLATVFLKVGIGVRWDTNCSLESMVNEGIRKAYLHTQNPLRASIVTEPLGSRLNTGDNTPGVIHMELVSGDSVQVHLAAKGFGSENKARLLMLNPGDNLVEHITKEVASLGAGWCPPGILGVGIGGSAEKAMLLAKQSLLEPIDIQELIEKGPSDDAEALRIELYQRINQLGIGAQGLGGLTTVLDVKVNHYPTHAGALPVGLIPNCAATRHISFELDGSGPANFELPDLTQGPEILTKEDESITRVNITGITKDEIKTWKAGQTLLLSGTIITGRDAAHRRIADQINDPEKQSYFRNMLKDRILYYVGPVPRHGKEIIGPAGPTTASRMDKYSDLMLERIGILGMIGKGERGDKTIAAIRSNGAVYLVAVGGAAFLISQSIRKARVVAFEDLGMEAIYEFEVKDLPVLVGVDTEGNSIHHSGPQKWRQFLSKTK